MALEIKNPGNPSTITTGKMVLDASPESSELGGATVGPVRNVKMLARRKFLAPGTESLVRPGAPGEDGDSFMASEAEANDLEARGFAGRAPVASAPVEAPAAPEAAPEPKPEEPAKRKPGRPKGKK